jgi:hypothetical protein
MDVVVKKVESRALGLWDRVVVDGVGERWKHQRE